MEGPVVPLERNQHGHPLAGLSWERQFEIVLLTCGWEKVPNWECSLPRKNDYSDQCMWTIKNWLGKAEH